MMIEHLTPTAIATIIAALVYISTIVAAYIAIKVRLAQIDVTLIEVKNDIVTMEKRLDEYKSERENIMAQYNLDRLDTIARIEISHEKISKKVSDTFDKFDKKFDNLLILQTEVKNIKENCIEHKKNL